jgi:hypothetical protein
MKTNAGANAGMNRPFMKGSTKDKLPGVCLKQLVNQLLSSSLATAFQNDSVVTNEVSREVQLSRDKAMIAPVISDLLAAVISNSRKGQIYISAERYSDIITLNIQERNNYNGFALAWSIKTIEAEAAAMGASITINGAQQKVVTVSLSFPFQSVNSGYAA